MIGREIGNYRITQRLGQGGVGQVFAGVDEMLNRPVAVKALRGEFGRDPAVVTRFRGEAESLARLNHPNITTLYSLQRDGDELFMIMELVRGQTLEALLLNRQQLSEREALAVTAQALDGLRYAHNAGVIHRDIKTGNLMVAPSGLLKIMDFGIARVRGSGRLTRQGHIVGTLAYMSPEQIRGEEGDERSDLYSLAIVLYELLSGDPPFFSESEYALIRAQVEAAPPRLIDRVSGVRPEIEDAVMRALAKCPADRFATPEEFGRALGVFDIGGKAVDIVREGLGSVVSKATRIEVTAAAKPSFGEGDVLGRPGARTPRLPHSSERGSHIARSRASVAQLLSGRLPVAALVIAAAMVTGVIVYAVVELTRGLPVAMQTDPSEPTPSSGDSAHAEGGTPTVSGNSISSAMEASQGGYAEVPPATRPSDETEPTDAATEPRRAPDPQVKPTAHEGQLSVVPSYEPHTPTEDIAGSKDAVPPARNPQQQRRPHKSKRTPPADSTWKILRE